MKLFCVLNWKGKTLAKDATMEHVAKMLDHLEHAPESHTPGDMDEGQSLHLPIFVMSASTPLATVERTFQSRG